MTIEEIPPALFAHIASEAFLSIMVFNKDGHCIFANKKSKDTFRFDAEGDLKIEHLYPEKKGDNKFKHFSGELLQNIGYYQNLLVQNPNGPLMFANVDVKKIKLGRSNHFIVMIQDVTIQNKLQREVEEKQKAIYSTYQELLTQNEKLKTLDDSKNKFIALTTHELRTPVSAIFATAEVLKLKFYDNEEQLNEFIEQVYDQASHLLELVNDVLDISKIQAGKMDYYVEQNSIIDFCKKTIPLQQPYAEKSNIKLDFSVDDNISEENGMAYYDPVRLKQVINNILSNSIKYNTENGSVKIWLEDHNDTFRIYFKDTGPGISKENFSKIFNEFETLGKVSQHHKGTGLGLPISKKIMETMGGTIELESTPGKGTTFWIIVPKNKVLNEDLYKSRNDDDLLSDLVA